MLNQPRSWLAATVVFATAPMLLSNTAARADVTQTRAALPTASVIGITDQAVVHVDNEGKRYELFQLPTTDIVTTTGEKNGTRRTHEYGALLVHEPTGRWALPRSTNSTGAGWTILFGDINGHVIEVPADPTCGHSKSFCAVAIKTFSLDGDYVFVESLQSRGTSLLRYRFGAAEAKTIAGPDIANHLALDPLGSRAIYRTAAGLHVVPWTSTDDKIATSKPLVVMPLVDDAPSTDGEFVYAVTQAKPRAGTWLDGIALGSGERTAVYRPNQQRLPLGVKRLATKAGVFFLDLPNAPATDCDGRCSLRVVVDGNVRLIARNVAALRDVSDNGHSVLITHTGSDDVFVIDVETLSERVWIKDFGATAVQFTTARPQHTPVATPAVFGGASYGGAAYGGAAYGGASYGGAAYGGAAYGGAAYGGAAYGGASYGGADVSPMPVPTPVP